MVYIVKKNVSLEIKQSSLDWKAFVYFSVFQTFQSKLDCLSWIKIFTYLNISVYSEHVYRSFYNNLETVVLYMYIRYHILSCTVKPVLRGHLWDTEKVVL
jgi:hypothetical protein